MKDTSTIFLREEIKIQENISPQKKQKSEHTFNINFTNTTGAFHKAFFTYTFVWTLCIVAFNMFTNTLIFIKTFVGICKTKKLG